MLDTTLNQYQLDAHRTATKYSEAVPTQGLRLLYLAAALTGESGEVANIVKKVIRDDSGILEHTRREALLDELGDCLWYLAEFCTQLDLDLSEVAQHNIDKLEARFAAKNAGSSGD